MAVYACYNKGEIMIKEKTMGESRYNVLIIGSGGREHALAWKISQSPLLKKLYTSPGNAGTARLGTNLGIGESDFESLKKKVIELNINMVVVGPEVPLVNGISDFFQADRQLADIMLIGPPSAGALLEGSKDFAKAFMQRNSIPTADYQTFHSGQFREAISFLSTMEPPYVLKADGLAAGKGVIICPSLEEASDELELMLQQNKFGDAGNKIVIEQFLIGTELSVFILTDGSSYLILPEAKDYKRIGENDTGPNTGGMGAVSPVPFADAVFMKKVEDRIIKPTLHGLKKEGIPYNGFIFFGLISVGDQPYVIEYNARLGDPETEVVLPRIQNDLLELLLAVAKHKLEDFTVQTDPAAAACVMLVAPGYPGNYPKGMKITGLEKLAAVIPFHAGTREEPSSGNILTNGGRILGITAMGPTLQAALKSAYAGCNTVNFDGKYYRKDLGNDLLNTMQV